MTLNSPGARRAETQPMPSEVFQSAQARELIAHVRETYGDELEFLWRKFPKNAIWRHPENRKWYAALLSVQADRILEAARPGQELEILDLRFFKGEALDFTAHTPGVYPGYHMNKQNWITLPLDGSLPSEQIFALLAQSHEITK